MSKVQAIKVLADLARTMKDFVKYLPGQPRGPDGRFAGGGGVGGMAPDTGGSFGGSGGVNRQASWEASLTKDQINSIGAYTKEGFEKIRGCQGGTRKCTEETIKHIKNIEEALSTAPGYSGKTYRGLAFKSEKDVARFVARVKKNGVVEGKGFVSSSENKSVGMSFTQAMGKRFGVLLVIQSKSGVSVKNLSKYTRKEEQEVLFNSSSKFSFKRTESVAGLTHVIMEEV